MKSSRIALSLLLALQGAVVIALGNVEGRTGDAAQVDAREILGRGPDTSMGPSLGELLGTEATKTPAVLPGVDPLAVGIEMSGGVTEEFDFFCYEYGVDYEAVYGDSLAPAAAPESTEEPESWPDHGDYFASYGYDSLEVETAVAAEEQLAPAVGADSSTDPRECASACPEEEIACEAATDALDVDALLDLVMPEEEYVYDGEYDYVIVTDEEAEVAWKYVDPYDYYGSDDEFVTLDMPETPVPSQWKVRDLLRDQDIRLIGRLFTLDQGQQRAELKAHLEALGWYAVDFAALYEEATGQEVLSLLPLRTAAFLAAYRLYEQGTVDTDEAIDILAGEDLLDEWFGEVKAAVQPLVAVRWGQVAENLLPAAQVASLLGSRSMVHLGGSVFGLSQQLSSPRWQGLVSQARQLQSACRPIWGGGPARR